MEKTSIEIKNVKGGRCEGSQVVMNMKREEFSGFTSELCGSGILASLLCDGILRLSNENKKVFKEIAKKYGVPVTCDTDIVEINTDINRRIYGRAKEA